MHQILRADVILSTNIDEHVHGCEVLRIAGTVEIKLVGEIRMLGQNAHSQRFISMEPRNLIQLLTSSRYGPS